MTNWVSSSATLSPSRTYGSPPLIGWNGTRAGWLIHSQPSMLSSVRSRSAMPSKPCTSASRSSKTSQVGISHLFLNPVISEIESKYKFAKEIGRCWIWACGMCGLPYLSKECLWWQSLLIFITMQNSKNDYLSISSLGGMFKKQHVNCEKGIFHCNISVILTPSLRRPCIHAIFFSTACRTACKHAFCFLRVRPEAMSTRHSWLWQNIGWRV